MPPRKKPLKAKKPMNRGKGPKQSGGKPKPSRPKTAAKPVVDLVKERSGGWCEIGLKCRGMAPATERAHRMGKGSGGVGKKNLVSNEAANLLDACHDCHVLIDKDDVAGAERMGLKLRHGKSRPDEMPVHLHNHNGWVLLDNNGNVRRAPEAACTPGDLLPVIRLLNRAVVNEAAARRGHGECGGWTYAQDAATTCWCGTALFVLEIP